MVMKNCHDVNRFVTHFEVNRIRKSVKQCPMDAIFDFRKLVWHLDNSFHHGVKLHQQFGTKTRALLFVPSNRVDDIQVSIVP
jgi:hypothetical protein